MEESALQTAKLWLMGGTGLAKDALHVHIGLIVYLGSALVMRWPLRSWKPWLAALGAAVLGEAWDVYDRWAIGWRAAPMGHWHDVWNTMLWPSAMLLLARYSGLFARR
ncbi:hypothetical protein M9978_17825 [Sphingomonas sp. MG17]|uniref:Uncharacterized protein n=2 Tax=Sphingomonas tagetis TaxID=2949092 RepID=A0A9X2KR01_9SPHN|nr:hypothetical protein [Sphingomonas tagetis]